MPLNPTIMTGDFGSGFQSKIAVFFEGASGARQKVIQEEARIDLDQLIKNGKEECQNAVFW